MAAKTWMGWGLAVAGILAAGPLVLERGNPALATAHDEIAGMSEVERATLKRKYDQYRSLKEEQRAALRNLHQELETDRGSGARDLGTLQVYCDWLKTIDAWQQDELGRLDDPQAKAKRVSEIVNARRAEVLADASRDDENAPSGQAQFQPPRLSEDQLTKVFDQLAKRLALTEEEQKAIDALHGLKRFGVQSRHIKKTISNPGKFFPSISMDELSQMANASGNPEFVTLLASGPGEQAIRKRQAIFTIFSSLHDQLLRESAQSTDAELQAYFVTLAAEEQDEQLQLRADEFKTQLRLKRLESDPDVLELETLLGKQYSAAKRRLQKFQGAGGFRGPQGPGGPPFDPRRDGESGGRPRPFQDKFGKFPPRRPGEGRAGDDGGPPERPDGERRPPRPGRPPEDGQSSPPEK